MERAADGVLVLVLVLVLSNRRNGLCRTNGRVDGERRIRTAGGRSCLGLCLQDQEWFERQHQRHGTGWRNHGQYLR